MDEERKERPAWVRLPAYDDESDSARLRARSGQQCPPGARGVSLDRCDPYRRPGRRRWLFRAPPPADRARHHHGHPGRAWQRQRCQRGKPVLPAPVATSSGSAVGEGDGRGDN